MSAFDPANVAGKATAALNTGLPAAISSAPATPSPAGLQPGQGQPSDVGYNGNVPGAGENVANSYLNMYGSTGTPSTTNDAQTAYNQFASSTPADMSSYYDNAQRQSDNAINTQMAARGSYGSSNAVGVLSNADTNLRAQQAKDEASYGLSRATLGGQLASGADASSLASSNNDLNWMTGTSDLAFKDEKEQAARAQLGLDNTKQAADTLSGIEGSVGGQEIGAQQQLLTQQLMAQGMSASDAATAAANKVSASNAQDQRAVDTTVSALSYFA